MIYLFGYILVCIFFVFLYERNKTQDKEHFFAASRRITGIVGAMSIAASWVWAPALFVSSEVGYKYGFSGLVWFTVPNILTLMIIAPYAAKIRKVIPEGYSYVDYVKLKFEGLFFKTQLSLQLFAQILIYAIQLTAGSKLLSLVSGIEYHWIVLAMGFGPLLYTYFSGLSSSVLTDFLQYIVMVFTIAILFYGIGQDIDFAVLKDTEFKPFDPTIMIEFGIASALTLIFGIFIDQQQWQRAFSVKGNIVRTFAFGGVLHGLITFSLGTLGVLLAASGHISENAALVVPDYISGNLDGFFLGIFLIMALCGLCSTLDSSLCAFSSLFSLHLQPRKDPIKTSRIAMLILASGGVAVSLGGIPLITLWMFVGMLRLCNFFPCVFSISLKNFNPWAGTLCFLMSIVLFSPLYVYASLEKEALLRVVSMVGALISSGALYGILHFYSARKMGYKLPS